MRLGRLNAGDVEVVRTWEWLDRALLDGRLPALQHGRPEFPLRGDGSALEREAEAAMARWPK